MDQHFLSVAQELKHRLTQETELVDLRVFGSRARGTADEYSDLDVFIEIELLTREAKKRIQHIAWQLSLENNAVISPLIFSRHEVECTAMRSSSIIENIMRDGVKI